MGYHFVLDANCSKKKIVLLIDEAHLLVEEQEGRPLDAKCILLGSRLDSNIFGSLVPLYKKTKS